MAEATRADEADAGPWGLSDIFAARRVVQEKWYAWDRAKEAAKEAKAEHDGAVTNLMAVIDRAKEPPRMPLFDRPAASAPDGQAAEAAPGEPGTTGPEPEDSGPAMPRPPAHAGDDWKARSLLFAAPYGLTEKIIDILNDASIFTLGQLVEWTDGGKTLTDIGGIGPTKAAKIADAVARFFAEHESTAPEGADD